MMHLVGSKPKFRGKVYDRDGSRNLGWCWAWRLGWQYVVVAPILTVLSITLLLVGFGEHYHGNHHRDAQSPYHGVRWFDLDITKVSIVILRMLGLVTAVKRPKREFADAAMRRPENAFPRP
jgi:hypothetical protein